MKIESLTITINPKTDNATTALRDIEHGQMIRIDTAQEWRRICGSINRIAKERGLKFETRNDGDGDVIIFIKESPKKV